MLGEQTKAEPELRGEKFSNLHRDSCGMTNTEETQLLLRQSTSEKFSIAFPASQQTLSEQIFYFSTFMCDLTHDASN